MSALGLCPPETLKNYIKKRLSVAKLKTLFSNRVKQHLGFVSLLQSKKKVRLQFILTSTTCSRSTVVNTRIFNFYDRPTMHRWASANILINDYDRGVVVRVYCTHIHSNMLLSENIVLYISKYSSLNFGNNSTGR